MKEAKKEKDKETPKVEEKISAKSDKELYWIMGVMAGLILIFLASNSVFQSLNQFEYQGLSFSKEKLGDITLFKHSYAFTDPRPITGNVIQEPFQFNLYLRTDPRENTIPIEGGKIMFSTGNNPVLISVNTTGLTQCEYSNVAISNLANFLSSNLIINYGATPDIELAEQSEAIYATCDTHPENQVITVQKGDETGITLDGNCYTITAAKCEILPVVERFVVQSIVDARARQNT